MLLTDLNGYQGSSSWFQYKRYINRPVRTLSFVSISNGPYNELAIDDISISYGYCSGGESIAFMPVIFYYTSSNSWSNGWEAVRFANINGQNYNYGNFWVWSNSKVDIGSLGTGPDNGGNKYGNGKQIELIL